MTTAVFVVENPTPHVCVQVPDQDEMLFLHPDHACTWLRRRGVELPAPFVSMLTLAWHAAHRHTN